MDEARFCAPDRVTVATMLLISMMTTLRTQKQSTGHCARRDSAPLVAVTSAVWRSVGQMAARSRSMRTATRARSADLTICEGLGSEDEQSAHLDDVRGDGKVRPTAGLLPEMTMDTSSVEAGLTLTVLVQVRESEPPV